MRRMPLKLEAYRLVRFFCYRSQSLGLRLILAGRIIENNYYLTIKKTCHTYYSRVACFFYALFVAVYSGMLPCFFGGLLWFLLRAISSARISLIRVSRGMITSSTSPRSAAR